MHLPEYYIDGLLELVVQKKWPNRSEIIRAAIRDLLKKELKGFSANTEVPTRIRDCSKCGAPMYLARDEGVYFCARCKSFFHHESIWGNSKGNVACKPNNKIIAYSIIVYIF